MEVRGLWQWHDDQVMKPDKTEVTFKYDALGRRIEKCSEGKATHFVWDGNTSMSISRRIILIHWKIQWRMPRRQTH